MSALRGITTTKTGELHTILGELEPRKILDNGPSRLEPTTSTLPRRVILLRLATAAVGPCTSDLYALLDGPAGDQLRHRSTTLRCWQR
jgi:hypothetical protein